MSWEILLLTGVLATVHAKWNKHKNKVVKVTIYLTFIKWKNVSSYWSDQLKTHVYFNRFILIILISDRLQKVNGRETAFFFFLVAACVGRG